MSGKSFLLLSDIHATDRNPSAPDAPSYVSSFNSGAAGKSDPLVDLRRLLRDEGEAPSHILCAGDMTNRSDPNALSFAWEQLQRLAGDLNAKLVSTVGNHDIDSRYLENKYDPRGYAMALAPTIPIADRTHYLEYWAEHFTLIPDDDCNILVVNTAAFHGGGKAAEVEIEHGRISDHTLAAIEVALRGMPEARINLALCHHHPQKPEAQDRDLEGLTRGGAELVELLSNSGEPWVVVHGHKHVPEIYYGQGGGNAPVILGCASFSAQVNRDAQNKNPNQVHLLKFDHDAVGLALAGEVRSWSWQPGVGWAKTLGKLGLPHRSGFGHRGSPKQASSEIDKLVPQGPSFMSWSNAIDRAPYLRYILPKDIKLVEDFLKAKGIKILRDDDGQETQIGRQQ